MGPAVMEAEAKNETLKLPDFFSLFDKSIRAGLQCVCSVCRWARLTIAHDVTIYTLYSQSFRSQLILDFNLKILQNERTDGSIIYANRVSG
jgi:hypothetical protein